MRKPLFQYPLPHSRSSSVRAIACAQPGSQLRFCLASEPKTLNPLLVDDEASDTVRYLTGGVLMRLNRLTQQLEPELATSWKVGRNGNTISFTLRPNVRFSDGTPFTAEDVAYTMQRLMDPALHSPTGDSFRSSEGKVVTQITGSNQIIVVFPRPLSVSTSSLTRWRYSRQNPRRRRWLSSARTMLRKTSPALTCLLKRNPNYWKHDNAGRQLPYIESVRLDIQQNRDIELLRLVRGEIGLINSLSAEYYDKLARTGSGNGR